MLILQRKVGESLRIGDEVEVRVLGVQSNQIKPGIEAPKSVPVRREELKPRAPEPGTASSWG